MGKKSVSAKMDGFSKDVAAANREALRAAFPGCFSEGRVDWATLAALCGENSEDLPEAPILRGREVFPRNTRLSGRASATR
jgi:hypothetical protein